MGSKNLKIVGIRVLWLREIILKNKFVNVYKHEFVLSVSFRSVPSILKIGETKMKANIEQPIQNTTKIVLIYV